MNPVFLGLIGAASWSIHDVIAARASKSIGAITTAGFVTLAGLLFLSAWLAWSGGAPSGPVSWLWLPLIAGAGIALATIWLFAALAAGSLSLALPIVMCYPVTSLAIGALAGRHPSMMQLAAAALAIGGVLVVARSEPSGELATISREAFRRTVGIRLAGAHRLCRLDLCRPVLGDHLRSLGGDLARPDRRLADHPAPAFPHDDQPASRPGALVSGTGGDGRTGRSRRPR